MDKVQWKCGTKYAFKFYSHTGKWSCAWALQQAKPLKTMPVKLAYAAIQELILAGVQCHYEAPGFIVLD